MKIDRILIVLGAALLAVAVVFAGSSWFANMLSVVPTEAPEQMPEWIARLVAGVIALGSLTIASYLTLQEWRKSKAP